MCGTGSTASVEESQVACLPDPRFHILVPQYGEFRCGYAKDASDTRMVAYGIRYLIENYISKPWTLEDVERADTFYK